MQDVGERIRKKRFTDPRAWASATYRSTKRKGECFKLSLAYFLNIVSADVLNGFALNSEIIVAVLQHNHGGLAEAVVV